MHIKELMHCETKKALIYRNIFLAIIIATFLIMLLCNFLTPKIADDYSYEFSFTTGQKIDSLGDIFISLIFAHAQWMNGRLVAHFFVHIFESIPKPIFNVLNAAFFIVQALAIYIIAKGKTKWNFWLLIGIISGIIFFQPSFGQVNFWLDGACNYMWCSAFSMLLLIPIIKYGINNYVIGKKIFRVLYVVACFFIGAYNENTTPALVVIFLCTILVKWYKKEKVPSYVYWCVALLIIGYLFMITAPAELLNKGNDMNISLLRENFIFALNKYSRLWVLVAVDIAAVVLCFTKSKSISKCIISIILFIASLAANFVMIFARYYQDRNMFIVVTLLVLSTALSAGEVFEKISKEAFVIPTLVLLFVTINAFTTGINELYKDSYRVFENEDYIMECKSKGILDIEVPIVTSSNEYSPLYELEYLNAERSDVWPNDSMARSFGVNSILGVWK